MNTWIKRVLKAAWGLTGPVRRPFDRKFQAYLEQSVRSANRELALETAALVEERVRELVRPHRLLHEEMDAVVNQLLTDLVRLQDEVESLRDAIDNRSGRREPTGVAGDAGPAGAYTPR